MFLRTLVSQWLRSQVQSTAEEALRKQTSDEKAHEELPPPEVAILFALGIESGGVVDSMEETACIRGAGYEERRGTFAGKEIAVVTTGVGCKAASRATLDYVRSRQPQWVISAGFAGGLNEDLHRGHVLMADRIARADQEELAVGLTFAKDSLAETPGVHVGRLLTVDRIVHAVADKKELGRQKDALAVDMETWAVAHQCQQEKVRFLSVRIISDPVNEELPPYLQRLVETESRSAQLGAAVGALFKKPSSIKEMWRLKESALKASDHLARFLEGVVRQLD